MEIKKVALLGAGAVGSYVIWGLCGLEGVRLGLVAEGARAERLASNGCKINGQIFRPEVWTSEEAQGADLLIVALKYGALSGALPAIKTAACTHTTVMSLMNGVDSEDIIATQVDKSQIVYSLIKVASHGEDGGYVFDPEATIGIIFGETQPPYDSDRIRAIDALLKRAGLHARFSECIREEMWSKFRLNVCNNLPQAILGAGIGCYRDSVHMQAIQQGLRRELESIAAAKGIDMSKVPVSSKRGSMAPPTARYSTLQDLDAKRHTEIDMFALALMKMGAELGISTPYCEYTYHMIKAIEEKNDGLFNYEGREDERTCSR